MFFCASVHGRRRLFFVKEYVFACEACRKRLSFVKMHSKMYFFACECGRIFYVLVKQSDTCFCPERGASVVFAKQLWGRLFCMRAPQKIWKKTSSRSLQNIFNRVLGSELVSIEFVFQTFSKRDNQCPPPKTKSNKSINICIYMI